MSVKTRLYLNSILLWGLPYALGMIVIDLVRGDIVDIWYLWSFLFYFIFFGVLMTLFFTTNWLRELGNYGIKLQPPVQIAKYADFKFESTHDLSGLKDKIEKSDLSKNIKVEKGNQSLKIRSKAWWTGLSHTVQIDALEQSADPGKYRIRLVRPFKLPSFLHLYTNEHYVKYLVDMMLHI